MVDMERVMAVWEAFFENAAKRALAPLAGPTQGPTQAASAGASKTKRDHSGGRARGRRAAGVDDRHRPGSAREMETVRAPDSRVVATERAGGAYQVSKSVPSLFMQHNTF